MFSPPFDWILHCFKAPLGQLSLSRVTGNKTPGLCCKTFPLQEAIPEGEVEEIQRIMEQEAVSRVRFLNHCLYEPEQESHQSLRVRKSSLNSSPKNYQNYEHTWSVTMKLFLVREKREQSSASLCL